MDKNIIKVYGEDTDTFTVMISLSYNCNFSCFYCGYHHDEEFNDTSVNIKLFEKVITSIKNKHIKFLLFGGEPTIVPQLPEIIELLLEKYNNISFDIQTNTSQDLQWFHKFIKLNEFVKFTCSYQHHMNRTNNFSVFLDKVEFLNKSGLLNNIDFMLEPLNEREIIDIVHQLDKSNVSSKALYTYVDFLYNPKYEEISKIINDKKISEGVYVEYKNGDVKYYSDTLDLKQEENDRFRLFYCYAGMTNLYVESNGKMYRCLSARNKNNPISNELDDYIENGPHICTYDKCICEIWVKKVRAGYHVKI